MKFYLTSGTGYGNSYGSGNGSDYGYGYGYGFGNSNGHGDGYGNDGDGYGDGYSNGRAEHDDHIHPRVSADPDLRVAIQTAALQMLLHLEARQ